MAWQTFLCLPCKSSIAYWAECDGGDLSTLTAALLNVQGGTDVLQEAVDQGWLGDVLAREIAASLLVGLKIQEGHLD